EDRDLDASGWAAERKLKRLCALDLSHSPPDVPRIYAIVIPQEATHDNSSSHIVFLQTHDLSAQILRPGYPPVGADKNCRMTECPRRKRRDQGVRKVFLLGEGRDRIAK